MKSENLTLINEPQRRQSVTFFGVCDITQGCLIGMYDIARPHMPVTLLVIPQTEAEVSQIQRKFVVLLFYKSSVVLYTNVWPEL
jgi:hypothetical protein